ncbi:MAG: hypothetical protein VX438_19065 [Planctomycetota bacterium]|nr:hypothetical protein [Planctomycetota bacterium]
MILLIGIIVLFIALIVFIVLCAKQTHWLNLVALFLVFLFSVSYLVVSTLTFKTKSNWKEVLEKNLVKYEKQEAELQAALTGSPNDFEWPIDSLKGLETAAAQQVLGQGRVWRQCIPGAFTPGNDANDLTTGSLTLDLPPDSPAFETKKDPAGGDDAAEGTSLVYVFLEVPDGEAAYKVSSYIGSFFATEPSADNTSVKLSPSLILPDPANTAALKTANPNYRTARELVMSGGNGSTRWAMYDILPIDSYDVFVESIRAEQGDPEFEVTPDILREKLTTEYMPIEALKLAANPNKYKRIIDSIVYTNQKESIYKDSGFEPTDDEKWYRVKFKRNFKNESFKVDFKTDGDAQKEIALQGQSFDRDGLALLEILKLSQLKTLEVEETDLDGEVKFEKDQTVLLDHLSWEKTPADYITTIKVAGELEVPDVIYRRKLNDFDYDFRALVEANKQLTADRDHASDKLDQLKVIDSAYESQKSSRLATSNKLNKDVNSFKKDKSVIENYRQQLEAQLAADRKEVDRYFRLTKEYAAKKAELEAKMSKLVEENTQKAEAAIQ